MNIKTLFSTDDNRAVSPVIGVILMVAITVILAAVIGAFVLDLGSQQSSNAQAGVTVDGSTVTVNDLGPSTKGVYCSSESDLSSAISNNAGASSVGSTFQCSGDSIIGVTDSGDENVVKQL